MAKKSRCCLTEPQPSHPMLVCDLPDHPIRTDLGSTKSNLAVNLRHPIAAVLSNPQGIERLLMMVMVMLTLTL